VAAAALDSLAAAPAPQVKTGQPAPWAAVPESSWEAEAKRAAMLASTWDVTATRSADETQDVPSYVAESPAGESPVTAEEPAQPSAYSGHSESEHKVGASPTPVPQETVEPPATTESDTSQNWAHAWEPAAPSYHAPETPAQTAAEIPPPTESTRVPEPASKPVSEGAPQPEPVAEAVPAAAPSDMDELVARVLAKMNPDVLQRVTQEILKPVIEVIVRDELDSKKK
jgi:hypothetical protein